MGNMDPLAHWMDPLSPDLVGSIARLVADLHRDCEELQEDALIMFEVMLQKAEEELDVGSFVLTRLSLKLAWELREYVSRPQAIQFLENSLRRAGQDNFGAMLNLVFFDELGNLEKLNSQLLDIANKNKDPIQQLLAIILICKTYDSKKRSEKCRSVYEKIKPLLQRAYKLSPQKSLSPERQYYFFTSCLELSRLDMKHEKYEDRVDILYEALAMVSRQEENFDLIFKAEIMLLRALKRTGDASAIKEHCDYIIKLIELILRVIKNREILEMKYCSDLREAFFEVSVTLGNCSEPEFLRTMDNLMDVHLNFLGQNHHEVALLAAVLARHYYFLGETHITDNLIGISDLSLNHGNENLDTVIFAKIHTVRMLAGLFQDMKQLDKAEKYRFEDLRLNRKRYGMNHHFVASALQSLSRVRRDKGDHEGAIQYLEQSLEMMLICQPQFKLRHKQLKCEIRKLRRFQVIMC